MATELCRKGCVNKCDDAVTTVHACAQFVIFVSITVLL